MQLRVAVLHWKDELISSKKMYLHTHYPGTVATVWYIGRHTVSDTKCYDI